MEDSIYESIPKTKNAKEFLDVVSKKYTKESIPSIRRNLIYVPILDRLGYSFLF